MRYNTLTIEVTECRDGTGRLFCLATQNIIPGYGAGANWTSVLRRTEPNVTYTFKVLGYSDFRPSDAWLKGVARAFIDGHSSVNKINLSEY